MKRLTKGYSGVEVALFPDMLNVPTTSSSRITSSPSQSSKPSPEHTTTTAPSTSKPQHSEPSPTAEEYVSTPHESPLYSFHSHGSDKGRMKLNEILKVKKLENHVKTEKARRKAKIDKNLDTEVQEKVSKETELILQEETPTEVVQDQGSGEKGQPEVTTAHTTLDTARITVSTVGVQISNASTTRSTAGRIVYSRMSEEMRKDKGKAIMTEL
ncbi:hypothetical protein Tco_1094581 [Tanacetum coccineum]|uniref:Uncharacterized protein n=1 Tax=Tanacetum coccineum TaxID=301880 RepID=A0ABQ5IFX2_9ASTR